MKKETKQIRTTKTIKFDNKMIRTTKTVTVEGEMILPGKELEVKTKIANDLIDRDAAEKVKNISSEDKEN